MWEIVLLIVSNLVVGAFTLLGVYLQHRLTVRYKRRRNLRALYDEINLNLSVSQKNCQLHSGMSPRTELDHFYTASYQNARTSGDLMELPTELRMKLEQTYNQMYSFNRRLESENVPIESAFVQSLNNNLLVLKDMFPTKVKL
jgi:hypothetical protein